MPVDDALALAEHVLAAFGASGPEDTPGPDLLWADQLARALRKLADAVWGRAGRLPGPGAVVLSAAEADTAGQALADAGAWHAVYGDCAACVAAGTCIDNEWHELLAGEYAALRARLGGEAR
jgi:hypothetical protein